MNRNKNEVLILLAETVLQNSTLLEGESRTEIQDSYNGQIAALGVSVATTGLRPTLAIYYQDKPDAAEPRKVNRRAVLEIIAQMIEFPRSSPLEDRNAKALLAYAISESADLNWLKREVIDCSVALKQVVRTYKLI